MSRAGGLAILSGLAAGLFIGRSWKLPDSGSNPDSDSDSDSDPDPNRRTDGCSSGLSDVCVSLADDVRPLSPVVRIVVHLAAGGCVVLSGLPAEGIAFPGGALELGAVAGPVFTVLFVAWMVNLYNFMDGMDGFAGGMAVIGFTTLAALCVGGGAAPLVTASLIVAAASLGFLLFNFPPAKIFMGDVGSSLLGFLAAVGMLWAERAASVPLWIPVLVFSPFIVDASVTLVRRTLAGEKPWQSHRGHFYQRLVLLGWGHRKTVVRGYVLMLLCAVSAVVAQRVSAGVQTGLAGCVGGRVRRSHSRRHRPRTKGWGRNVIFATIAARLRSRGTAFGHDLLMIPAAWLGALWLRFNLGVIPEEILAQALRLLPVIVIVQGSVFLYFGLYRGVWRFASVPDLVRIIQAVVVGVALCALAAFLLTRMVDVPRASFPLFAGLLVAFLSAPRLAYRWLRDRKRSHAHSGSRRTLIVGAGAVGEMLVRELRRDSSSGYLPVGFVDDAREKRGREVHGVRVLGPCSRHPGHRRAYRGRGRRHRDTDPRARPRCGGSSSSASARTFRCGRFPG